MRMVVVWAVGVALALLLSFRVGNAFLIHEGAKVVVSEVVCPVVGGTKDASGLCLVTADVTHSFLSENPVLKLSDGRVVELRQRDVEAVAFKNSRYGWL